MMKLLSDYCVYIENQLPSKICDDLVDLFESVSDDNKRIFDVQGTSTETTFNNTLRFTQIDFTKNYHLNEELHRTFCQYLIKSVRDYQTKVEDFCIWAPRNWYFENLRIKRYISEDKGEMGTHVDVANDITEGRYLSFLWYLNDVNDGGETEFPGLDFKVKPKKGALLMFPPLWMFPHKAHLMNSGKKYLLNAYLHYPEPKRKDQWPASIPLNKFDEGF